MAFVQECVPVLFAVLDRETLKSNLVSRRKANYRNCLDTVVELKRRIRDHMASKRKATRADQIYSELLSRISDRQLVGGQLLVISHLAEEFSCSTIPVREALARLREKNLVEYRTMQGFRVAPSLTPDKIHNLFVARLEIEVVAARYASVAFPSEIAQKMQTINNEIGGLSPGRKYSEYQEFVALNEQFHFCLIKASGNDFLYKAYQAIGYNAQSARILHGVGLPDHEQICEEHNLIVNHLTKADTAAAVAVVRDHIRHGYERLYDEPLQLITDPMK